MPRTVLDLLVQRYPTAKRQTLRHMLQAGRVLVNGQVVRRLTDSVVDADVLAVDERPAPAAPEPRAPAGVRMVFEDADLLVVDKPAGLLTSTVPREPRPTLLAKVREHVEQSARGRGRVGLIHRLDRGASGLLVFSKNDAAYRSLKSQFYEHTVERVYGAVVHGTPRPRAGRIETHLVERADGVVYSARQHGKGERAVTDYEVTLSEGGLSFVRVTLLTGRKHQIRVHLGERGTPIVGDAMYGREGDPAPRLMLAAVRLSLDHPRSGQRLTWELPVPEVFPLRPEPAAGAPAPP